MSSPILKNTLDTQAEALLQQVTDDRERRCAAVRAAAESQAMQIVRAARSEARNNVHKAVAQERTRMDLGMRQARARADIEASRRERQKSQELLQQLWAAIAHVLERRWRDPVTRRAWIDAVMGQAGALLRTRVAHRGYIGLERAGARRVHGASPQAGRRDSRMVAPCGGAGRTQDSCRWRVRRCDRAGTAGAARHDRGGISRRISAGVVSERGETH